MTNIPTMSALHLDDGDNDYDPPFIRDPTRPHSIDLTLELERQLEAEPESMPNSPTRTRHSLGPELDPTVVASIVTQLRMQVEELRRERDDLRAQLGEAQTTESGLRDALEQVSAKCARVEEELAKTVEKQQENEDAVTMLRSKLDDSR